MISMDLIVIVFLKIYNTNIIHLPYDYKAPLTSLTLYNIKLYYAKNIDSVIKLKLKSLKFIIFGEPLPKNLEILVMNTSWKNPKDVILPKTLKVIKVNPESNYKQWVPEDLMHTIRFKKNERMKNKESIQNYSLSS